MNRSASESEIQIKLFSFLRSLSAVDPRFGLSYSVPNEGAQTKARRLYMYRMGATNGVSDVNIDLPSPDGQYGYLRIELKSVTGKQSVTQQHYQGLVTQYGHGYYSVCQSLDDVLTTLACYFKEPMSKWQELWALYGPKSTYVSKTAKQKTYRTFDELIADYL